MISIILLLFTVVLLIVAALNKPDSINRKTPPVKRAKILSVVCVMGYLWALVGLAVIISPTIKKFGTWYPALFGILVSLKFISYVGVWHMKKWGVELMLLAYSLEVCLAFTLDFIAPVNIVIGILSLAAVLPYYRRMSQNL
jgi:hypothetical protein